MFPTNHTKLHKQFNPVNPVNSSLMVYTRRQNASVHGLDFAGALPYCRRKQLRMKGRRGRSKRIPGTRNCCGLRGDSHAEKQKQTHEAKVPSGEEAA